MSHKLKNNRHNILIWIIHYFIYYIYLSIVLNSISVFYLKRPLIYESGLHILVSPILGALGIYDGLVIIIPIVFQYLLTKKLSMFKSYSIISLTCYLSICIYLFFKCFNYEFKGKPEGSELHIYPILMILPGVLISMYFVRLYCIKFSNTETTKL